MINETDVQEWLAYAEADRQAAEHLLEKRFSVDGRRIQ